MPEDTAAKDSTDASEASSTPLTFTVLSFNVGTTDKLQHDKDEAEGAGDGYTSAHAARNASHYANNLAWWPAEEALTTWLGETRPEVVLFQELFHDPWCDDIETDPAFDFICHGMDPARPRQAQRLLGDDYDVACAPGHPDNCVGVLRSFGRIQGCPETGPCDIDLDGMPPPSGCTGGARVATAVIELTDGRLLHAVDVHTVAGITDENMACRVEQFHQVFVDRGDGKPAAWGANNVVGGDMNMDPFLWAGLDPSADAWNQYVGDGKPFHYLSSDGPEGTPTIATLFRIDHVVSDALVGSCVVVGATEGVPPVLETSYWDHRPLLCEVEL